MILFDLVPLFYRWCALIALMVALGGYCWLKGAEHESNENKLEDIQSNNFNRAKEIHYAQLVKTAQDNAASRANDLRRLRSTLSTAAGGLRDTTDERARVPGDTLNACRSTVATFATVFRECHSQLEELAETADRHASDSLMLQEAWPK